MTGLFKIKEKLKLTSEAKLILTEIFVFIIAYILMGTKFIFGVYPFGIAYLCSLRKHTPFGFLGCLLSVIVTLNCNIAYLIALLFILGLRIAGGLIGKREVRIVNLGERVKSSIFEELFCENIEVRVSIAALGAFGIGLYSVIISSYSYYDIFALIFFVIISGLLTYALSASKRDKLLLGYGIIAFSLIYASRSFMVFSLDVSIILAYGLILYISKHLGATRAGAYGMLLGLCVSPELALIFAIGGLVSGLLWSISYYLAIMCAGVLVVGYAIFAYGYSALITVTPPVIFVSLIIYPLLKFKMLPVPSFIKCVASSNKSIDTVILERNAEKSKNHLSSISTSFSQIADIISKSQENEKAPTRQSMHVLCLNECENYCYGCPKHFICWQNDVRETEENLNRLSMELFANGTVGKSTVTERFLHRCPNIDLIIEKINVANKKKTESAVKNNKLEVASYDYQQIAKLLNSASKFKEGEEAYNSPLNKELNYQLAKIGLLFEEARIIGKENREVIITGINIERSKCTKERLREELTRILSREVGELEFYEDGEIWNAYVSVKPIFKTKDYSYSIAKSGENENGDSFMIFDGVGGKKYMVLCDGMGSGENAREVSSTSVSFLKEIISVSTDVEIALTMLGSLLRARAIEYSTTVDILEIDLNTGKGSVIKCGASPTYIKRGDKVFKLQSKTMPLGILKELDAEESSFEIARGDICIMISDGVADSKNDEKIVKLISEFNGNIDTLAYKIIEKAKKQLGQNDDMTVLVTEICAN